MIRVGLVGYGLAGRSFHAPLVGACDRMELSAVLTSRDAPHRVASLEELLDSSDLVVVASPNQTHFPIAKAALEAGRHVVVDKPFTVTVEEADALIGLASESEHVLTVFHNRRWDGDFLTVRKLLPELGEVHLFEAHWDRYRPEIKRGWHEVPSPGAGLFNDIGPHMIDQALQLFGKPDSISAEIIAQRPHARVDDYFDVMLSFGRRRVCLRSSSLIADPRPRFAVHGANGSFVKFGLDAQETQLRAGIDPRDPDFGNDRCDGTLTLSDRQRKSVPTERGNYVAFYDAVAASILDGAPVPVVARDARDGLLIIDLARRGSQSRSGRMEVVPGASSTGA